MDLFQVGNFYVNRIFNAQSKGSSSSTTPVLPSAGTISATSTGTHRAAAAGGNNDGKIKVLLLDRYTTSIISMCATQSDLLNHEIYLVETIENSKRDVMRYLRCLVYVRPTDETIDYLVKELENPRYGEYYIFFNNMVSKNQLERLAEADNLGTVMKVEEIFQDYLIVNEYLFSFEMAPNQLFSSNYIWNEARLTNCTSYLVSLLLSLRIRPEIGYDTGSKVCRKLAESLEREIERNERALFAFPTSDSSPLLIILDRNEDPFTPLLQPWTYQSMINEYIGIKRNVVDLSNVAGIDPGLVKVTLSPREDEFFHDTMYLNFGELGDKVKGYVTKYKNTTQTNMQINTLEDIKLFIEKYPEFKKLSGNVSKHMAIVGELDKQLGGKGIWDLSECEQNMVVHRENQEDYNMLLRILRDPNCENFLKLKISIVYLLRHDELNRDPDSNIEKINEILGVLKSFLPIEDINYLHKFRKALQDYRSRSTGNGKVGGSGSGGGGSNSGSGNNNTGGTRQDDLFKELAKKFNSRMELHRKSQTSNADNVYMQYIPRISKLLTELSQNRLPESEIRFLGKQQHNLQKNPPQDVILFIVGGITYEESRYVYQFNETMREKQNGRMRVIAGGTSILSIESYLNMLR